MKKTFTQALLVAACLVIAPILRAQTDVNDSLALVALYNSTNGPGWHNHTRWLNGPVPAWFGVTVGGSGRVTIVKLNNNGLTGTLPILMDNLELQQLLLSGNALSGSIPLLTGSLTTLSQLTLFNNYFTFRGMAFLAQNFSFANYSPQHSIPLHYAGKQLSVSAGGQFSDNTYNWYKDGSLLETITGDSIYGPVAAGSYYVTVTNRVATGLTLYSDTLTLTAADLPIALLAFTAQPAGANYLVQWQTATETNSAYFNVQRSIDGINFSNIGQITAAGNSNSTKTYQFTDSLKGVSPVPPALYYRLQEVYNTNTSNNSTPIKLYTDGNTSVSDSLALVDLYNSTGGPNWKRRSNWLTGPLRTWYGIEVEGVSGRVIAINLNLNGLSGSIPASTGSFTQLAYLNFSNNQLTGSIPSATGGLTRLHVLNLSNNQLSGGIPTQLGSVTGLQYLNLANNRLTGSIPSATGNLTQLAYLNLANNQLSGSIPTSTGNLTLLWQGLDFSHNQLSDSIPASIGNLILLQALNLSSNRLSGSIPSSIGHLVVLQSLNLSDNQLSGGIPPEVSSFASLQQLHLENNHLTFSGMEQIALAYSFAAYTPQYLITLHFNGSKLLVAAGGTPANNTYTWYRGNTLVATVTGDSTYIPKTIGNYWVTVTNSIANQLTLKSDTLTVKSQAVPLGFTGKFAGDYATLQWQTAIELNSAYFNIRRSADTINFRNIGQLTAAGNNDTIRIYQYTDSLKGISPLPQTLYYSLEVVCKDSTRSYSKIIVIDGDSLALVDLYNNTSGSNWRNHNNWLTGHPLGTWYGIKLDSSGRVTSIDLNRNGLTGSLSSSIGNLAGLISLDFSGNQLRGSIPSSIGNLAKLTYLDLSGNELMGGIPPSIGNLTSLEILNLSINPLSGSIPSSLGKLSQLTSLFLERNQLSGIIPASIGNLRQLTSFYLDNNRLSGSIPVSTGNLTQLENLSLANNHLSGSIPSVITSLARLSYLYIYNNDLTFSGMEALATFFRGAGYSPQYPIPLHFNGHLLSVSAGGTLSNNTYKWYNNNTLVATTPGDSVYTPAVAGKYSVAVTNSIATRLTLYSDTLTITGTGLLATKSQADKLHGDAGIAPSLQLYPNPVHNTLTMLLKGVTGVANIVITDAAGKVLHTQTIDAVNGQFVNINTSLLTAGIYFVRVQGSGKSLVQKFIKE